MVKVVEHPHSKHKVLSLNSSTTALSPFYTEESFYVFSVCFGRDSAGVWTQGLALSKQLYHLIHSSSLFYFNFFFRWDLTFLPEVGFRLLSFTYVSFAAGIIERSHHAQPRVFQALTLVHSYIVESLCAKWPVLHSFVLQVALGIRIKLLPMSTSLATLSPLFSGFCYPTTLGFLLMTITLGGVSEYPSLRW
jgi:hypothetical protein